MEIEEAIKRVTTMKNVKKFQQEYKEKTQRCIEGVLNNYRKVETYEDLEWNRCNEIVLLIIKEEMRVEE